MRNKRFEPYKKLYIKIANLIIFLNLTILFFCLWINELNIMMDRRFENKGNILMIAMYVIILLACFKVWGAMQLGYVKNANLIASQVLAVLCTNILADIQIVLMVGNIESIKTITVKMLLLTSLDLASCALIDFIVLKLYLMLFPPYRMLQINGGYKNYLNLKLKERDDKYQICEEISVFEKEEIVYNKIKQYEAVLLNDIPSDKKNKILKFCFEHSVRVYFTPKISDIIVKGSDEINLFDSPLFLCKNMGLTIGERMAKRLIDVLVSLIGLVILSPVLVLAAIAIKMHDGGPVFFKQKRCTYQGRVFWIYKFRSMIVDAEKDGKSRPATEEDDRITPIGKIIRKTRIDELPQLINILKGDMSLVGPRPERVEHVEKYCQQIPEFAYRLKVKGGLTGYAQVYGRYNTTAYDKLKMDMLYIVNYSFLMDIQILFETVKILFQKQSTQGFSTEQFNDIYQGENK